jgi:hypothetical protein
MVALKFRIYDATFVIMRPESETTRSTVASHRDGSFPLPLSA